MPRRPEENERIRRQAKEKIRNAAMEQFTAKGYHATSIEDVAGHAGISKGLLYNYYQGKEDLLASIVQARIGEVAAVMEDASGRSTPKEQLRAIVDGAIDAIHRRPDVYRFFLNLQTQPQADQVLAQYGQLLNNAFRKQFEVQCGMFERLGVQEPRMVSLHFSTAIHGAMLMLAMFPGELPPQTLKAHILEQFGIIKE